MNLYSVNHGYFKLDGGAVFGVVLKASGTSLTRPMKTICAAGLYALC